MEKFSKSLNGYDKNEVNLFVKEFTIKYSSLLDALKLKDQDLKEKEKKLEYYQNLEKTLNKALLVAEESSMQIKKIAREEGQNIIDNAHKNASRIVNEALLKAESVETEAEELKRRVISYKRRLKVLIEDQLNSLDDLDDIKY